jgi:hypothetical protein
LLSSHYFYLPLIPDTFSNDVIKSLTDLLADDHPQKGEMVQELEESEETFMLRLNNVAVGDWKGWLEKILKRNAGHRYWFPDHSNPRHRRRFATPGPKLIGALMTMFEPQWKVSEADVVDPDKFHCPPGPARLGPVSHIVQESKPLLETNPQEFD